MPGKSTSEAAVATISFEQALHQSIADSSEQAAARNTICARRANQSLIATDPGDTAMGRGNCDRWQTFAEQLNHPRHLVEVQGDG